MRHELQRKPLPDLRHNLRHGLRPGLLLRPALWHELRQLRHELRRNLCHGLQTS